MTAICVLYVLIGVKLKRSRLLQSLPRRTFDANRGLNAQGRVIRMLGRWVKLAAWLIKDSNMPHRQPETTRTSTAVKTFSAESLKLKITVNVFALANIKQGIRHSPALIAFRPLHLHLRHVGWMCFCFFSLFSLNGVVNFSLTSVRMCKALKWPSSVWSKGEARCHLKSNQAGALKWTQDCWVHTASLNICKKCFLNL